MTQPNMLKGICEQSIDHLYVEISNDGKTQVLKCQICGDEEVGKFTSDTQYNVENYDTTKDD